jgi:NADPH2:quinone reductase
MQAVAIENYGGRDRLKVVNLPRPEPAAGEILVRIRAAGVNPVDTKVREGLLKDRLPNIFPIILGWDAAGIVEAVGPEAGTFSKGAEVFAYCRKPIIQHGTYAEYVCIPESFAAPKPRTMSFVEASAIPLAGLTAYQSLHDVAGLGKGQTVLIHAAAGGVGGFAVQIAKNLGARVIGTASAANHDYVRGLGADEVIDYTKQDFRDAVRALYPDGVDVAFDTVGGDVQTRSADVIRKDGVLVSLLAYKNEADLQKLGIRTKYHFVTPNGDHLRVLAAWADNGKFRVHIAHALPLEQAARAHELIESRHTQGKIVLVVG